MSSPFIPFCLRSVPELGTRPEQLVAMLRERGYTLGDLWRQNPDGFRRWVTDAFECQRHWNQDPTKRQIFGEDNWREGAFGALRQWFKFSEKAERSGVSCELLSQINQEIIRSGPWM